MAELANCVNCDAVFVKNIRSVCHKCYKEEEDAFDIVYHFLTKRENRKATSEEIVEATKVEMKLITKFIKEGRLRVTQFPNLAYPCEKCGADISKGRICDSCSKGIISELGKHEEIESIQARETLRKEKEKKVYYSYDKYNK